MSIVKKLLDALEALAARRWVLPLAAVFSMSLVFVQARFHLFSRDVIVDSYSYYFAARAISQGLNPYDGDLLERMGQQEYLKPLERFGTQENVYPYLYPPVLAAYWRVFTLLPPLTAHRAVVLMNALLLGVVLWLIAKIVRPARHPHALLLIFILFQAVNGAAVTSTRAGQVNILLLVFMLVSLYSHLKEKDSLSALFLVLAILIKITPALLLAYFVLFYHRRWEYVGWALLWTFVVVGSSFWLAPPVNWLYFFQASSAGPPLGAQFSIWGWLSIHGETNAFLYHNKGWLYLGIAVPLLILGLWSIKNTPESERPVYAFAQLMMLSLLLSPLTWHHHYIFFMLPGYYLFAYHWGKGRRFLTVIFGVLLFLVVFRFPGSLHMIRPIATLLTAILAFRFGRLLPEATPAPAS